MGVSSNSHGKKFDKECQSPMLKIFKDIMQKEKNDPEKTNLLVNKKEERKKKYFSSRNKSERRSRESSSSEQRKRSPFKTSVVEQRTGFDDCRTQSIPFQNEKRDSWFFWGETEKAKPTEDTCSCVSCALKKIVSSEYACVGCLLVLLTISIVVAFLVVCKNVPTLVASERPAKWDRTLDSERLKRKIDMLNNRKKEFGSAFDDKSDWKNTPMGTNGVSQIAGSDFGPSFRELNALDEDSKFSGDLNGILDNDKINELQNSERLRDFYRKLMQTDTQIRNLKKTYGNPESDMLKSQDRIKRSIFHNHFKKNAKITKIKNEKKSLNETNISPVNHNLKKVKNYRLKRLGNYTNVPMAFVIEKKKLLIQYKPTNSRKIPKCSHTPKDSNAHEKQLNHPFYKNTQRLDELLDTFLYKNLPEIMSDPFGIDKLFKTDKDTVKHPKKVEPLKKMKIKDEKYSNSDILKILNPESTTGYQNDLYKQESSLFHKDKGPKQKVTTKSDYDIVLSVSTILNPGVNRIGKTPLPLLDKVPNIRRLMQIESDDDEDLGYEDLQEVLTDDLHNHDEFDRSSHDRQKRKDGTKPEIEGHMRHNTIDVHNPNWKGPMPLYPDELNTVVKEATGNNKVEFPVNTKDIKSEIDKTERDLNDIEYVEDYLNNKYDKLVQMAQAYSDYGVLDGKKVEKEKNSAADEKIDHRVKLSVDTGVFKRGLFQRKKKNPQETDPGEMIRRIMKSYNQYIPSEGIKLEFRPTSNARDDVYDISKILENHLKITHEDNSQSLNLSNNNFNSFSTYPYIEMMYSTENYDKINYDNPETTTSKVINPATITENSLFPFGKGKRALLSIKLERDEDIETATTAIGAVESTEDTTLYHVTDMKNYGEIIHDEIQEYLSTVVYEKDDENNKTGKTCNTLYENKPPIYENKVTTAIFINKTDLQNTSSTESNENINVTGKENTETDITIVNKHSSNDQIFDDLDITTRLYHLVALNDTQTLDHSSQLKLFLATDEDDDDDEEYPENYSFPIVLYFNEDTNDNKSNIEIKIVANDNNDIKINNITLNKRDVLNITEYTEDIMSNNNTVNEYNSVLPDHSKDNNNDSLNHITDVNTTNNSSAVNNTKKSISVSDFFMLMSDWFVALEGININPSNSSAYASKLKTNNERNITETLYPLYDAEMIENIGHRSRVLLSVTPANMTEKSETADANVAGVKGADVGNSSGYDDRVVMKSNILNASIPKFNITEERDANAIADDKEKDGNKQNRTIVKRNADSNLIFWNDIYDEEYGVETERFDNALRDKLSVSDNGFIKKSGKWMQDKIKQLAQNLKKKQLSSTVETPTARISREVQDSETDSYPKYVYDKIYNKIRRRQTDNDEDDYDTNQKSIFAAMTNNMKEVCKKAAQAVHKTRNIEVREDSKQETIATSLMQQLVRLMNDLVDYQVQQKTCAKLPSDLQNFLEWLTSPEDERHEGGSQPVTFRNSYQDDVIGDLDLGIDDDKSINQQSLLFTNDNTDVDSKTECLGTLHDVQDLMQQYEVMTDEDKSKMTGVKKYLEDQLDYLSKQISGYNIYDTDTSSFRFRRDLTPHHRMKRRLKRKLHKFMRNYGKKHTRTTASYYDAIQITDCKRKPEENNENTKEHDGNENNEKETNDGEINENEEFNERNVKRNLQDVYYKAIEEAKRFTTINAMQTTDRKGRYGNEDVKKRHN